MSRAVVPSAHGRAVTIRRLRARAGPRDGSRSLRRVADARRPRTAGAERDELLPQPTPPLRLAWRIAELTSPTSGATLARSLRGARPRRRTPAYFPADAAQPRAPCEPRRRARRRLRTGSPTSIGRRAAGVLLVDLFTDGGSPLYDASCGDLPTTARRLAHWSRADGRPARHRHRVACFAAASCSSGSGARLMSAATPSGSSSRCSSSPTSSTRCSAGSACDAAAASPRSSSTRVVLTALAYPLGAYMARVYAARCRVPRWLAALERGFYRLVGTRRRRGAGLEGLREDGARLHASSSRRCSTRSCGCRAHLFLNPDDLPACSPHIALNTTASFVTNTNWQYYGGEYTMSYLTPDGRARRAELRLGRASAWPCSSAVIRGFARRSTSELGNFWVDLYRSLVYILLPLALVLAVILVSQGVVADLRRRTRPRRRSRARTQTIARGPAALADRDQAARHERRRLLQLELGRPVREPERASRTSSRCSRSC